VPGLVTAIPQRQSRRDMSQPAPEKVVISCIKVATTLEDAGARSTAVMINTFVPDQPLFLNEKSLDDLAIALVKVATDKQEHPKADESSDAITHLQLKYIVDKYLDDGNSQQNHSTDPHAAPAFHNANDQSDDSINCPDCSKGEGLSIPESFSCRQCRSLQGTCEGVPDFKAQYPEGKEIRRYQKSCGGYLTSTGTLSSHLGWNSFLLAS